MELAQPSAGPSVAAYPRWVLLDRGSRLQHPSTADTATLARCYSSTGCPVQVSFRIAAPPAVSTLHVHVSRLWQLPGAGVHDTIRPEVLAAHGDSVLVSLTYPHQINDYFVYSAGAGCARPPSLSLLPAPCRSSNWPTHTRSTGILRPGGGDEFVVANLNLTPERGAQGECLVKADLFRLRSGERAWELCSAVPVRHADGQEAEMSRCMISDVIPVGDRFLCWIIRYRCILICDVTAASPELWYVPLPDDPFLALCDGPIRGIRPQASQNVCVTGGGQTVKFVRVSPRCCCGGPGATACARSRGAFTVTTWTLKMDDMTWEEDGEVSSHELWAAAASADVPRVPLEHPVVSMDDPDVVFFLSSDPPDDEYGVGDKDYTLWLVTVDMKRKTMRSVCRYPLKQAFLPSEVSSYFNTTRHDGAGGDSNGTPATSEAAIHVPAPPVAANRVIASPDDEGREILAVIREIPGLAPDEMLRAHSIFAGDDRRVRILTALPVDMRKEYCMLELERYLMHGAK